METLQQLGEIRLGRLFKNDLASLRHSGFKKKSIFFMELPYWKDLTVRHNLDVMYIEKNVMDNILDVLNLTDSPKDTVRIRNDMNILGIHPELHVTEGENFSLAMYSLD